MVAEGEHDEPSDQAFPEALLNEALHVLAGRGLADGAAAVDHLSGGYPLPRIIGDGAAAADSLIRNVSAYAGVATGEGRAFGPTVEALEAAPPQERNAAWALNVVAAFFMATSALLAMHAHDPAAVSANYGAMVVVLAILVGQPPSR